MADAKLEIQVVVDGGGGDKLKSKKRRYGRF